MNLFTIEKARELLTTHTDLTIKSVESVMKKEVIFSVNENDSRAKVIEFGNYYLIDCKIGTQYHKITVKITDYTYHVKAIWNKVDSMQAKCQFDSFEKLTPEQVIEKCESTLGATGDSRYEYTEVNNRTKEENFIQIPANNLKV
jgi:hypothetical protein